MKVKDIMKHHPRVVNAADELSVARDLMVWTGIRHLPVMRDGHLVGVLSDRDLLAHQAQAGAGFGGGWHDRVEKVMHGEPQTCGPEDSLTEIAGRLAAAKIGCLPVTERGRLVGLVTVTDVLEAEVRVAMEPVVTPVRVADAMTPEPIVVHPGDHLLDAAERMRKHGIRHLPVVDGDRKLVGMLSDRDVRSAVGTSRRRPSGDLGLSLLRVADAMSRPGVSVNLGEGCSAVARHFATLSVSAVAVTDDRERVVGMLSYVDLLRAMAA